MVLIADRVPIEEAVRLIYEDVITNVLPDKLIKVAGEVNVKFNESNEEGDLSENDDENEDNFVEDKSKEKDFIINRVLDPLTKKVSSELMTDPTDKNEKSLVDSLRSDDMLELIYKGNSPDDAARAIAADCFKEVEKMKRFDDEDLKEIQKAFEEMDKNGYWEDLGRRLGVSEVESVQEVSSINNSSVVPPVKVDENYKKL